LDVQKEKLKRYAGFQNMEIVNKYSDEDKSGKSVEGRPEFRRRLDFGVNLICVEDGIDSSKDSGKLVISVLSAIAEIERENILVQTMEG
jgi:site-specific DNA recombinase